MTMFSDPFAALQEATDALAVLNEARASLAQADAALVAADADLVGIASLIEAGLLAVKNMEVQG